MNKSDLIDRLAELMDGDKKSAQTAVESSIDAIQRGAEGSECDHRGVRGGREAQRAARTARNPRTGEQVTVTKTTVPVFRPGRYFRDVVAGDVKAQADRHADVCSGRCRGPRGRLSGRRCTDDRQDTPDRGHAKGGRHHRWRTDRAATKTGRQTLLCA